MKQHYIPEAIIDEIRTRTDIVEVISDHVLIKKSGQSHKGLCPFHPEKTPSFTVSPNRQIYHCFGCGAGGNVFKFLMEKEGISFVEAVKKLAGRCHVTLPQPAPNRNRPGEKNMSGERETLFRLNAAAADYFASSLRHQVKGKQAREYLQSRSFDGETISKYQLGWAPPAWRELLAHFETKGKTSRTQLEKAGLVKKKEDSADGDVYYDRFRGRIIFPLKNIQGNIVGFAGRIIIENEKEPKYLNSPETLLYKKGDQLFGLHTAKEAIRKEDRVLIVEGYFDQIRASQMGIRNVVATSGTALTPKQVALLKNHTRNAVLVFDADLAGQSAAHRGFDLFLEQGMNVNVVALPEGHDPDSYLHEHGREAFLGLVESAKPYVEYFIWKTIASGNVDTTSGRMEVVNNVLPLLCKIKSPVERSERVKLLAEQLGIEDKALLAELKKAVETKKPYLREPESTPKTLDNAEEYYLLHLLLAEGNWAGEIRKQIPLEAFQDKMFRDIAELFYTMIDADQPVRIDRALDRTNQPETKSLLTKIGLSPLAFDDLDQAAADCMEKIKFRNIKAKIKTIRKERNEAEKAGQTERSRQLHKLVREMQTSLDRDEARIAL